MKKENIEFLQSLVRISSPSSCEEEAGKLFKDHCLGFSGVKYEETDVFGNVVVSKGSGPKKIMISAHIDEIGYMVQTITENGFLHVARIGGVDVKTALGAQVLVNSRVPGVIGKKPIHVESPEDRKSVNTLENLLVDVGCSNAEEVEKLGIQIGDPVVYAKEQEILEFGPSGDFMIAPALDDKLGVYACTEVLRRVKVPSDYTLYCVAMCQEEVGLRGAGLVASHYNPDISIDLDVTPSTEPELGINKNKFGEVLMGKGVVIPFGVDKSRRIANEMIKICEEKKIPYQRSVAVAGGTNTSAIQTRASDCETMLLSFPNQNMHTQVEKCSWTDTEACINLLTSYIESL